MFKPEDIFALFLIVAISVLLGIQFAEKKYNKPKNKIKYTCGVEGNCEASINGTYDTLEQCNQSCGKRT